ncbi:unnamed protein product [Rotaria sordida]|uniref:Very-long-chain 3-oxoacyl-CoA synthase n=1 Tax=Rotaria sordida TaxID=392033 RepID=A0A818WT30_9BILA|nr:unnamed protein product [Rotaria sordida]CAF3729221.1 unnamed protein product [Rotaria sordida]
MWHPDDFVFVPGRAPLTSLKFLVFISIVHFIMTCSLEMLMTNRTKPINVRRIQRYNNLLIGIYSGVTLYIFYLSKLWKFIDIYFVILNKTPVLMHFRWRHQTTSSVVLASLLGDVSYEWATIVSNSLLHTFTYPHFAGVWNAYPILLVLGAWQLIVGLSLSIYGITVGCDGSFYAKLWGLLIYITYTIGYLNKYFHLVDRLRHFISTSRHASKTL